MRFLGTRVSRDGEDWKFEVQVYLGEIDPTWLRWNFNADPMDDKGPIKVTMANEGSSPELSMVIYMGLDCLQCALQSITTPRIVPLSSGCSCTFGRESYLYGSIESNQLHQWFKAKSSTKARGPKPFVRRIAKIDVMLKSKFSHPRGMDGT